MMPHMYMYVGCQWLPYMSGINLSLTCKRWLHMYWGSTVHACMLGINVGHTCISGINYGRKCIFWISGGHTSVLVINGGCKCMLGINNGCTYTSEINGDHKCVSRIKGGCTYICWGQRWLHMFFGAQWWLLIYDRD